MFSGPNGSGKTNLLEAVSLLAPGRGLRGARQGDYRRQEAGASGGWAVVGRFNGVEGEVTVGTGTIPGSPGERRVFRLDGIAPRSQAEIAARVSVVWITPQMGRLFQEGAAARRRFLDRLVYALDPGHAREVAAHDVAVAQRNRLLAEGPNDPDWLAGLEASIARHAVAIAAGRAALAGELSGALAEGVAKPFPPARIVVECPIARRLVGAPALQVEEWVRGELAARRRVDAAEGGTSLGAHRADVVLTDAAGTPARLASTGQQKAMLVGVVLGHAALIEAARRSAPILLLDEVLVHLDPERRGALFAALARIPGQVLMTGTDPEPFAPLWGEAEFAALDGGKLMVCPSPGNAVRAIY